MTLGKRVLNKCGVYIILFSAALFLYGLIYHFSGNFSPVAPNPYNSYSRQAQSWLSGQLYLPENVPWLELAIYEGKYYVSFPPFPSVVMLPFVLFFGIATPDNAIAFVIALLSLFYAYRLGLKMLGKKWTAVFLSLFLVLGTNYLHVALWGSVWYIAQNMAFLLTLMAFYYAVSDNKRHSFLSLLFICAAMGCRPFNAVYVPVVLYLVFLRESREGRQENRPPVFVFKRILLYSVPAFVLGGFFMWLNYARFGNIFEFGHNYLPEFVNDPHGQFYAGRIPANLYRMYFNLNITEFPMFHGFAFWVASPIVISFFVYLVLYVFKITSASRYMTEQENTGIATGDKSNSTFIFGLLVLIMLHILFFSFHRTLGGHQFGSRYTVDTLPAFYLGLLFMLKKLNPGKMIFLNAVPMLFGLILNFLGTAPFMSYYYG